MRKQYLQVPKTLTIISNPAIYYNEIFLPQIQFLKIFYNVIDMTNYKKHTDVKKLASDSINTLAAALETETVGILSK